MNESLRRVREVVISKDKPRDHSVIWIDITDIHKPVFKWYLNARWVPLREEDGTTDITVLDTSYLGEIIPDDIDKVFNAKSVNDLYKTLQTLTTSSLYLGDKVGQVIEE